MGQPEACIPDQLVAGDSASWSRSFSDYRASDGWELHYMLVGPTAAYSFDGTANGEDFDVALAAATTVGWTPGTYKLQEYVTKASERHTLGITVFAIAVNLAATAAGGADTRSHAQKVLDSINAWLETRAPVAGSMTFNGRSISNYPIADLLALRDRFRREVALELAAECGSARRGHPVYASL